MDKTFFDQPVKRAMKTYDNIQKFATGQGDEYKTVCFLDYPYFKDHYKMIAIDLSKQQVLDAYLKAIQSINFTGNPNQRGDETIFFIIGEAKDTIFDFSQETARVL